MYKLEFKLGSDARHTLFENTVDWEIVAGDLKKMHLRQKCLILGTPEILDYDQRVIDAHREALSMALEAEVYELRIINEDGANFLYVIRKK